MMFDWDDHNIGHIARHNIEPEEAEDAIEDKHHLRTHARKSDEAREVVIGKTHGGRILVVIYTLRGGRVRVVTAREAKDSEKRAYRRKA